MFGPELEIKQHKWAIAPRHFESMLAAIKTFSLDQKGIEAIQSKESKALEGSRQIEIRDGVAVLSITGPIFPRAGLLSAIFGGSTIDALAKDFTSAIDNKSVKAIILNLDSPGGAVTGVAEFADMIFNSRSKKPIVSYVYGLGASAAYWIASAAGRVMVSTTSELGGIGIATEVTSTKQRDAKQGIETIEIVSSMSPKKRPDVSTQDGRAQIQARIDELAMVFVEMVARNRGVSVELVTNSFGKGDVMVGAKAVSSKLADGISSLEVVISDLAKGHTPYGIRPTSSAVKVTQISKPDPQIEIMRVAAAKAQEIKRQQAIDDQAIASAVDRINECRR